MYFLFFFNDTATTEIYTLSLHDALPICVAPSLALGLNSPTRVTLSFFHQNDDNLPDFGVPAFRGKMLDRKSTRLNSSHGYISYAVFCLKQKTALDPLQPLIVTSRRRATP